MEAQKAKEEAERLRREEEDRAQLEAKRLQEEEDWVRQVETRIFDPPPSASRDLERPPARLRGGEEEGFYPSDSEDSEDSEEADEDEDMM